MERDIEELMNFLFRVSLELERTRGDTEVLRKFRDARLLELQKFLTNIRTRAVAEALGQSREAIQLELQELMTSIHEELQELSTTDRREREEAQKERLKLNHRREEYSKLINAQTIRRQRDEAQEYSKLINAQTIRRQRDEAQKGRPNLNHTPAEYSTRTNAQEHVICSDRSQWPDSTTLAAAAAAMHSISSPLDRQADQFDFLHLDHRLDADLHQPATPSSEIDWSNLIGLLERQESVQQDQSESHLPLLVQANSSSEIHGSNLTELENQMLYHHNDQNLSLVEQQESVQQPQAESHLPLLVQDNSSLENQYSNLLDLNDKQLYHHNDQSLSLVERHESVQQHQAESRLPLLVQDNSSPEIHGSNLTELGDQLLYHHNDLNLSLVERQESVQQSQAEYHLPLLFQDKSRDHLRWRQQEEAAAAEASKRRRRREEAAAAAEARRRWRQSNQSLGVPEPSAGGHMTSHDPKTGFVLTSPSNLGSTPAAVPADQPEPPESYLGVPLGTLPERGKLLAAIVQAGPILETLFITGPLPKFETPPRPLVTTQPQWRHPLLNTGQPQRRPPLPPEWTPPLPRLQLDTAQPQWSRWTFAPPLLEDMLQPQWRNPPPPVSSSEHSLSQPTRINEPPTAAAFITPLQSGSAGASSSSKPPSLDIAQPQWTFPPPLLDTAQPQWTSPPPLLDTIQPQWRHPPPPLDTALRQWRHPPPPVFSSHHSLSPPTTINEPPTTAVSITPLQSSSEAASSSSKFHGSVGMNS